MQLPGFNTLSKKSQMAFVSVGVLFVALFLTINSSLQQQESRSKASENTSATGTTITSTPSPTVICPVLPSATGKVILSAAISQSGSYKIWSRMMTPDTVNNTYWLQVDNGCGMKIQNSNLPSNAWGWIDYKNGNTGDKVTLTLTSGSHTITLIGDGNGVGVDRLLFTTDLSCTPAGTGDNCSTVTNPTVTSVPPTPTKTPTPILPTPILTKSPTPTNTPTPTPKPTSTPYPTSTPVPGATSFNFNLLLHGLGKGGDSANANSQGNMSPIHPQRNISVVVNNDQNQLVLTQQGSVIFDNVSGTFKGTVNMGTTLPSGVYMIKVKADQFLRGFVPGIQTITAKTVNNLPPTVLVSGDINNDNVVNILDYNLLMGCYSDLLPATNCNSTIQLSTDVNDDGNVNQFDYNLFLRELTNRGGQ